MFYLVIKKKLNNFRKSKHLLLPRIPAKQKRSNNFAHVILVVLFPLRKLPHIPINLSVRPGEELFDRRTHSASPWFRVIVTVDHTF